MEGFEGFEAWQTAGLNASKKLLMSPWRQKKSCWWGLGALACRVRGGKRASGGFWRVWSVANGRLERQWQAIDVALKANKKLLMWPWCVGLRGQGCQKCFWRVLEGLRGFGGFEGFEAWQTAGLNGSKKLLMSPWRRRKSCWWLGASACGVRCAKKGFWRVLEGTAGLTASKKLLMSPWRPRKSCWCGLACQKSFWRVLEGLKPGKQQAWTPVKSYWCRLEGQEKAVDVALVRWPAGSGVPKKLWEGFGGFWRVWSLANGRLERQ